jgi:hypothetical protein
LYLAWSTLVVAQGVVAWSGLLPSFWTVRGLWLKADASTRTWLGATLGVVIGLLALYSLFVPRSFELNVRWPLGDQQTARIGVISAIVMTPTLVAVFGMWLSAVAAERLTGDGTATTKTISEYLGLRGTLQGLLWFVGTVIGIAVLSTGMLRQSMLASGFANEETYPPPLVLAYGAFFTMLLLACYLPAYAIVQRAGERLKAAILGEIADVKEWGESNARVAKLLGLNLSVDKSIKDAIAIFAPLVAGFVANALPWLSEK